jgi:hypothetical protein
MHPLVAERMDLNMLSPVLIWMPHFCRHGTLSACVYREFLRML